MSVDGNRPSFILRRKPSHNLSESPPQPSQRHVGYDEGRRMTGAVELRFRVSGWSAWTESLTDPAAWIDWAEKTGPGCGPASVCLPPADLPMMLRRRASPLGRSALAAAMGLPGIEDARYVMSSRHGEMARTTRILDSLAADEPPSPADFSMSVHHGLIGLLSIATGNRRGHSAVSAGPESFCYGLLEAAACTMECPDEPVVLVHYDERPGEAFAELLDNPDTDASFVAALSLSDAESDGGAEIVMRMKADAASPGRRNHALDFLRFLASGADGVVSPGSRAVWEWSRA